MYRLLALIGALLAGTPAVCRAWADSAPPIEAPCNALQADGARSKVRLSEVPGLLQEPRNLVSVESTLPQSGALPEAFVELWGGDCLPGAAASCVPGAAGGLPAHWVVNPRGASSRAGDTVALRIAHRWVRRIVWQQAMARYTPGTLYYRDGRQARFRSLRLGEDVLRLLREEGVEEVPLAAIAELHLPGGDPWSQLYDRLAVLCPTGSERLLACETESGVRVTASTARLAFERGPGESGSFQIVHPAWSIEPVWLPLPQLRRWRVWAANEVPLSQIEPSSVRREADLGGAWQWLADRNVQGGLLAGARQTYFSGFGVQAFCELQFPLPEAAREFRTQLTLDRVAGDGGCVQATVLLAAGAEKSLYRGPVLRGSQSAADTGWLKLERPGGSDSRLRLQVDALRDDRTPGADPLDIRDVFDWCDPLVKLDEAALRAERFRRGPRLLPAWQEWAVTTGDAPGANLACAWDRNPLDPRGCRLVAAPRDAALRLVRRTKISPENNALAVTLCRPQSSPPCRIEVRVGDRRLDAIEVPASRGNEARSPNRMQLPDSGDQPITVELLQPAGTQVEWQKLELGAARR